MLNEMQTTYPFCLKLFDHAEDLKRHVVAIHQRKIYKCNKCRAFYYYEHNLEKHLKNHNDDYFFCVCDVCYVKYKWKITLRQHEVRTHSDVPAQFICDTCGQAFKLKIDLMMHINRKYNSEVHICRYCGKSVTDGPVQSRVETQETNRESQPLLCHLCMNKFHNQTRLDNHLLHKKGYKCNECDVVMNSSRQLEYYKHRKHKPGITSPICKNVFISNLYQHVLTHAGIRPYNCDICGKDFIQRSSLFRHRRNHLAPFPAYKLQRKAYHQAERKA